jgi:SAM-dependent methyltransferase
VPDGLAAEPGQPQPGAAPRLDSPAAHPARVYSYWLGGKDHFQADREAAEEVIRHRPQVVTGARANRAFLRRVTFYAANGCGIRQFLDIGTGLPAPGATHQIAQQVSRSCRVVYADNDPVVLAHARALLTPAPGRGPCHYVEADVRDPGELLARATAVLDFSEPVAVLLLAVLHFIPDDAGPAALVAELAGALAPGSLLAISHLTADYAPGPVTAGAAAYNALMPASVYPRDRAEVTSLLGTLRVQWPGVVPVTRWRPSFQEAPGGPCDMYGAVARLPAAGDHCRRNAALELAAAHPDSEPAELAVRAAEYPGHVIRRETIADRTRYVARSTRPGTHPHTVVTDSLEELFAELASQQPHGR